ncbi:MAG: hypothetical protein AAF682_09190 [Planctomycetota bacterium]
MIATLIALSAFGWANDVEAEAAPSAPSVLARYDLSRTIPSFDGGGFEETMLLTAGSDIEIQRSNIEELYQVEGSDVIVDLITRLYAEEFEYEGREILMQNEDEMLVFAPTELQERIRESVVRLERALSTPVELQIDVLSLPGDGPAPFGGQGLVDESQLAGLPGGSPGQNKASYSVRMFAGRTSVLNLMRAVPMVVDYDVEIAQGASIHDPIIGAAEVGTRLFLRGAPTKGGIALSVYYTHGQGLQDQPVSVEAPLRSYVSKEGGGGEFVDSPGITERMDVAFRSAAFNTFLPAGKAIVMSSSLDMNGAKSREVVVIRRTGGELTRYHRFAPAGTKRELVIVNAEALSVPEIEMDGRLLAHEGFAQGMLPMLRAQLRAQPSEFLMDWASNRFSTWRTMGPWLLCIFDPQWDDDAVTQLEALLDGWKEGVRVVDVSLAVRSNGHGGTEPASFHMPARAGSECGGVLGVSSTALADYDVEVAQFSATADAQHAPVFSGLAFRARPSLSGGGNLGVDLDAAAHLRRGGIRTFQTGGPAITRIEEWTFDRMRVSDRVAADGGGRFVLGDKGAGTPGAGLALHLGLR